MRAYRLVKARYADTALDGSGAKAHGGRWNSKGVPMGSGLRRAPKGKAPSFMVYALRDVVVEVDINPVRVGPWGAVGLDALVVCEPALPSTAAPAEPRETAV